MCKQINITFTRPDTVRTRSPIPSIGFTAGSINWSSCLRNAAMVEQSGSPITAAAGEKAWKVIC